MSESGPALRALAQRCRQLAAGASLKEVAVSLSHMAEDYERQAERADEAEGRNRELPVGPDAT